MCSDESELLPIAIPVLLSTPQDAHYAIRATTLSLVGELAEWTDRHPDTLELVLKFILDGLPIPAVSTYSAKAVQSVCLKCKQRMAPHINLLLQVIQAADNFSLSNDAVLGLLKGITEVLTKMPPEEMRSGIQRLCHLHVTTLQEVKGDLGGIW
jgi:transportin-3